MNMRDKTIPIPGRRWYAGRWRTEEEIIHCREVRAAYDKSPRRKEKRAAWMRRKWAEDQEYRKKRNSYRRKWYDNNGDEVREKRRERYRTDPEHKERVKQLSLESRQRHQRIRPAKPPRIRKPKPRIISVPSEIRNIYARANDKSIIRIKYPTWPLLKEGYIKGDFTGGVPPV